MIFSDRSIKESVSAGRIIIDPYDEEMVQPSSIDLRCASVFRVFENHRYPHIDPKAPQDDLTTPVEATPEEPFILHPGEFVLGSTLEVVGLADDIVARLEGKSSLGCLGLLICPVCNLLCTTSREPGSVAIRYRIVSNCTGTSTVPKQPPPVYPVRTLNCREVP